MSSAAYEPIAYLDTSAFIPLIVREPATEICTLVWRSADRIVSTRLLIVKTFAALAQAERLRRLTPEHAAAARTSAQRL